MNPWIFWMWVFVALIALGWIMATRANTKQRALEEKLKSIPDFVPAISRAYIDFNNAIAIDTEHKKLAVLRYSSIHGAPDWRPSIYAFEDLIAAELVKDGSSVIRTQRGSQLAGAAIGGALLGPAGMLLGGLSGSKSQENTIEKLSLKIYTNDLATPVQEIMFARWGNGGFPPHLAQPTLEDLEQWYGRLRVIIERN